MGARVGQQAAGRAAASRRPIAARRGDQGAGNTRPASRASAPPRALKIVLQFAGRGGQ